MVNLLPEEIKVVNGFLPYDINSGAKSTDYISMENYGAVTFVVQAATGTVASAMTLTQSDDADGTTTTSLDYDYVWVCEAIGTTNSDTYTKTAVTSATSNITALGDSIYLIDVQATSLTDGYKFIKLSCADPGASEYVSCVALCYKSRYKQADLPTAIA